MKKTKVITMYLPQYHSIPENDEFWGKDFTDWISVKNSKPLFMGHNQPRVPLSGNYYDLSKIENVAAQAKLAKEYGIYGFGIYHYWFNNDKNLLTKPAEIIRDNKGIDINFFFAWDNISWKRSWSNVKGNDWAPLNDENKKKTNKGPQILIEHILGTEKDWENHFNYLLPYFTDSRYIKIDGKPVFVVYHFSDKIVEMGRYWSLLAQKHGFDGITMVYRDDKVHNISNSEYIFTYEPTTSGWGGLFDKVLNRIKHYLSLDNNLKTYEYDQIWKKIIRNAKKDKSPQHWSGAFVAYDDTPRRGEKGKVVLNSTPEKFRNYMNELLSISQKYGKEYILLTAWNEWGEGAYLEPDTITKYQYLQALKDVLNK